MESTLAVALPEIVSVLGNELGYGRGPAYGDPEHNDRQKQAITDCWVSGLRKFYRCGYEWSFLKPFLTLTFPSGATELLLPPEVGGAVGHALIATPATRARWGRLDFVLDEHVRAEQLANTTTTGRPRCVAITPAGASTGPLRGQRKKLIWWPAADQEYTVQARFYVLGDRLTDTMPYALGAAEHGETILAFCLAAAELRRYGKKGVHADEAERMLQVSIREDKKSKPQVMGQNDNGGHWSNPNRRSVGNPRYYDLPPVTYNGVQHALLLGIGLAMAWPA